MLQQALKYAELGIAIFPLHSNKNGICSCGNIECKSPAKHPRTANGVKDASKDVNQIKKWWSMFPNANIGVATGGVSGIVVLDIDNDDVKGVYGSDTLRDWEEEQGDLPDTWRSLTGGGGVHYIFKMSDSDNIKNRAGVLPGIDVRGNGGYIVAPPSIHISGRQYAWEISPEETELAPLPDSLKRLMLGYQKDGPVFELPQEISEGGRNDILFRLASSLRAKGLSESAIFAAVMVENNIRCNPPIDEKEIRILCQSAARYERGTQLEEQSKANEIINQTVKKDDTSILELTSNEVMESIFIITDPIEKQRRINELREIARKKKCVKDFDSVLKEYKKKWVKERISKNSNKVIATDAPLTGLDCGEWISDDEGVKRIAFRNDESYIEQACPHPIIMSERLQNIDTLCEKAKLQFYKDGHWQSIIVEKSTLASRNKIIELADRCIQITSETAKFLIQYLHDLEALNTDKIPLYKSVSRVGWVGNEFIPYNGDYKYDGDIGHKSYFESITQNGIYDEWKNVAEKQRKSSIVARIALNSSFASPLLWKINTLIYFTHLWGGTENGKTVATMFAMSVWGNPAEGKLVRTFNSTNVGYEKSAAFCNSIPLALNESQSIVNDKFISMDKIIYKLTEGQGKGRGTKNGGLESIDTWKLWIITSGESPLTTDKSGGGAKNRSIEIYCKDEIFDDAIAVFKSISTNYGFAGKEYIEKLDIDLAKTKYDQYYEYYKQYIDDKEVTKKQAMAAALLVTADFLSSLYVFGYSKEKAENSAIEFAYKLVSFVSISAEIDVVARAYDWVMDWVAINQSKFVSAENNNEFWGRIADDNVYIISSKLNDELTKAGFSYKRTLLGFDEKGYIMDSDGKSNTKNVRFGDSQSRCVCLKIKREKTSGGNVVNLDF